MTQDQRSFLDRFGGPLLLGFTILGIAALLAVFVQSSTKTAYGCESLLTPGPVEPSADGRARPGQPRAEPGAGRQHHAGAGPDGAPGIPGHRPGHVARA